MEDFGKFCKASGEIEAVQDLLQKVARYVSHFHEEQLCIDEKIEAEEDKSFTLQSEKTPKSCETIELDKPDDLKSDVSRWKQAFYAFMNFHG